MVRLGPDPHGSETSKFGLTDRIVRDDVPKIALEHFEHARGREVHVVQVRMVRKAVPPVRAVQPLNAVELRVAVQEQELGNTHIAMVIDLAPTTR